MQDGLISVVLPAFNAERTISAALTSLLEQTYNRFEVIVVDDGSTDSLPELLADLAAQDQRISIIRTPKRGVAAARNMGLTAAQGELIALMDADDISEPTRFEKQVAHLAQCNKCVAVGCRMTLVDGDNIPLPKQQKMHSSVQIMDRCRNFRRFPPSPPAIPHATAIFRSAAIKAIGGYRTYFPLAEDYDLWWRLDQLGEIHCLPDRLYRYRRHEASVTYSHPEYTAAYALLADLSAIARHFGLDDSALLEECHSTRAPIAAIQQYVRLIGERYPVWKLMNYKAITCGYPLLAGHDDRLGAMHFAMLQFLRNPLSKKRRRLISAAFSRPQPPGIARSHVKQEARA